METFCESARVVKLKLLPLILGGKGIGHKNITAPNPLRESELLEIIVRPQFCGETEVKSPTYLPSRTETLPNSFETILM